MTPRGTKDPAGSTTAMIGDVEWDRSGAHLWLIDVGDGVSWPLYVINGVRGGPTALLSGGVHGDEYEGPALVAELCRAIDPAALAGRLILLPAVSPSAIAARRRFCPVDNVDPNRSFPGDPDATLTYRIAAMVARSIIPQADIIYDVHAGGAYDAIVPSVMIYPRASREQTRMSIDAMAAFQAPVSVLVNAAGSETMLDGEAARQGKIFGCVELGSFGSIGLDTMEIGRRGLRNILIHARMLQGNPGAPYPWKWPSPRYFIAPEMDHELVAPTSGYFVPCIAIGEDVEIGSPIGHMIDLMSPSTPAVAIAAHRRGFVYILAAGGPVQRGTALAMIIDEVADPDQMLNAYEFR